MCCELSIKLFLLSSFSIYFIDFNNLNIQNRSYAILFTMGFKFNVFKISLLSIKHRRINLVLHDYQWYFETEINGYSLSILHVLILSKYSGNSGHFIIFLLHKLCDIIFMSFHQFHSRSQS